MLLRLGTCCFHLNKIDEMKDTAIAVLRLTETMKDRMPTMEVLVQDVAIFAEQLQKSNMFTRAADIMLACNKVIHKIEDPDKLLNDLLTNVMMCCALLKTTLSAAPVVRLRKECLNYVEKVRVVASVFGHE